GSARPRSSTTWTGCARTWPTRSARSSTRPRPTPTAASWRALLASARRRRARWGRCRTPRPPRARGAAWPAPARSRPPGRRQALGGVRAALTDEKGQLAGYRGEYTNYDTESHGLGGEVLGGAFLTVAKKLYDVLMRSDVGVVDVAWSIKEGADQSLRRLTLDQ